VRIVGMDPRLRTERVRKEITALASGYRRSPVQAAGYRPVLSEERAIVFRRLTELKAPGTLDARREFMAVMLQASPQSFCNPQATSVPESSGPKPIATYRSNCAGWSYGNAYPRKGDVLDAVREPDNPHDPNAIGLWRNGQRAGYVSRYDARRIAPQMDSGLRAKVVCLRARGNAKAGAPIQISLFKPEVADLQSGVPAGGRTVGAAASPMPAAAWYPDPTGRHEYRYWDGLAWSSQVADRGRGSADPI